MCDMARF